VSVNPVAQSSSSQSSSQSSQITKAANSMGQDAFLRLLTTQLQHQDPTKPQADGEFIAQLAQFSSLEQLTQMQATLAKIGTALGVPVETEAK
jgi:flagellar basal-body rod modification protein FlgD